MPRSQSRRHPPLARRGARVPGVGRRAKAPGRTLSARRSAALAHTIELVERELSELDEECRRVTRLVRRLSAARRARRSAADIVGELGASVLHLHVHTKGLDKLMDVLG